jgi:hypothetical protein
MSGASSRTTCPHCRAPLARLKAETEVFGHTHDLACFNDDCPYYVRGWSWMEQHFGVRVSYRYRIDADSGYASPIAVWSPEALRSSILPDDAFDDASPKEHP